MISISPTIETVLSQAGPGATSRPRSPKASDVLEDVGMLSTKIHGFHQKIGVHPSKKWISPSRNLKNSPLS